MSISYCIDGAENSPFNGASAAVLSTYRWFCRWYSQTGYIDASTSYLARKQKVSERTMYRRLSDLVARGCIQTEVKAGVERSIVPLVAPPPPTPKRRNSPPQSRPVAPSLSGVVSGVLSGVLPIETNADTQYTTGTGDTQVAPSVVADLVEIGISKKVACELAQSFPEEVPKQIKALEYRKPRDKAAVLVKSIREQWQLPAALLAVLEAKRKAAQETAARTARQALDRKRQEQREGASVAFLGLSAEDRDRYIKRACEALHKEKPAAYRMMEGKRGFDAWVKQRAIEIHGRETQGT